MLLLVLLAAPDAFDLYDNRVLTRIAEDGKLVKALKQLTPKLIVDHNDVLPRAGAAMLIVRTNGDRFAKLLVLAAKQKVDAEKAVPILQIERFTTFKEGEDRQVFASGQNLALFDGFRFSLDMGQVVPEALGGDLRFVVKGDAVHAEPLGKAKLWVLTKHDEALAPKKGPKFVMGDKVEPKHFAGTFRLYDDGRRSGKLTLKVEEEGKIVGHYFSDRDGAKYEVKGKIGPAPHAVEFNVSLPRIEQAFKGFLFTGDGKALAGTSRIGERESAFYAVREE
ncbi:MAG: hypothetical protein K2W96_12150 [Gemmataceae bacterium]|nr:hypothetical protein [Gemmataceae bacterium]